MPTPAAARTFHIRQVLSGQSLRWQQARGKQHIASAQSADHNLAAGTRPSSHVIQSTPKKLGWLAMARGVKCGECILFLMPIPV